MTHPLFGAGRTIACTTLSSILFSISAAAMGSQQAPAATPTPVPDMVLEGVVTGSQNQTYIRVPFVVPLHRAGYADFCLHRQGATHSARSGFAGPGGASLLERWETSPCLLSGLTCHSLVPSRAYSSG